jgi:hypothetical protein
VSLSLRFLLFSATCIASFTFAQAPPPRRNLVFDAPSASERVRLQGHVLAGQDELTPSSAVVPTSTLRLTFILSRTPELQAAFEHSVADQQIRPPRATTTGSLPDRSESSTAQLGTTSPPSQIGSSLRASQ